MQGLIDVILTQDGDPMLLGATAIQFGESCERPCDSCPSLTFPRTPAGYSTRGKWSKKYFKNKFPKVSYKMKGQTKQVSINTWLKCPRSKAAAAAFLGCDYNVHLRGMNLLNGSVGKCVKAFMKKGGDAAKEDKYLDTLEQTSRFSTNGATVRDVWNVCMCMIMCVIDVCMFGYACV